MVQSNACLNLDEFEDSEDIEQTAPITILNSRKAGAEITDATQPDILAENDTFITGSGDSDTI